MGDLVNYRKLIRVAMCDVVREALLVVADTKDADSVHIAISFITRCQGVALPTYLKEQYPDVMTVVLQYQFRDLTVSNSNFSVVLSFRGKEERVVIPYNSIVKYMDIGSNFSLDFKQYGDIEPELDSGSDNDDAVVDEGYSDSSSGTSACQDAQDNIIFIDRFLKN